MPFDPTKPIRYILNGVVKPARVVCSDKRATPEVDVIGRNIVRSCLAREAGK